MGLYTPILAKVLDALGYNIKALKADGKYTLHSFKGVKGMYLCEIKGHFVVMIDGRLFDNMHPAGSDPTNHRVIRAFEILPSKIKQQEQSH
jgi:hypothetical protein